MRPAWNPCRIHASQNEPCRECDLAARALYEEANAGLRRHTVAAWIRWEDVDPDARAIWTQHYRRSRLLP